MNQRVYRAKHLEQWNSRTSKDDLIPLTDKVVEAVMHHQGIPVNHTREYRNLYSYDKLWMGLNQFDQSGWQQATPDLLAGLNASFKTFSRPENMDKFSVHSLIEESGELFHALGLKEDRAAGLTAYGETKLEAFAVAIDKAIDVAAKGKVPSPCLAGVRTQRKGKTRLVWGYPLEVTILEALIARPLVDYFKMSNHVMSFGDYSHEIGIKLRRCSANYKYHYSLDYSQFDASVSRIFIQSAFNAFKTWFNLEDEVYPGVTLDMIFGIVERYFIYTPIVMPKRDSKFPVLVTGKKGGVPSGSYFTQLVDSFANFALIMSASKHFKLGLSDENVFVLGDDCLFFSNADISIKKISKFVSTFGFKVNPEKGSSGLATDDVEYLGRRWRNGFPVRTLQEIERGALYPEKYRKYSAERGKRQTEALAVLSSYLLTSYMAEESGVGTRKFRTAFMVSPSMTSGFTEFLLKEGLIPGKVLKRAIY